jgi:predicted CoA-binding protein
LSTPESDQPTVAVLGASTDRAKYGNKSVRAHLRQGYRVYPVNPKGESIEGLTTYRRLADVPESRLSRISVYLPPSLVLDALDEIAAFPHDELWLNPGAESDAVLRKAAELGLDPIQACSIVDLGMSPSELPAGNEV